MIYEHGKKIRSPGGSFVYEVIGPVCRLYDREQLPWPSCSLAWRGKQPSWRRFGPRFVSDLSARRCPSYAVRAVDSSGLNWDGVITLFHHRLIPKEQRWWYSPRNERNDYPHYDEL